MRRAATGLAYAIEELLGGVYGRRVVLLLGPGDNGGDALFAGAHLARRGALVEAWILLGRAHEKGLAALRSAGGRVREPRPLGPGSVDVVVDGVLGIGGRPGLPPQVVEAVIPIHRSIPFVAVDIPSGLDCDTGELHGMALRADLTVTFGTHKIAHLADPAALECGVVTLVDLGLDLPSAPVESLQAADVASLLPVPGATGHKYDRGVVGVRAGSARYPGAALLAVAGAAAGPAGMVRYVGSAADLVTSHHPELVGAGRVQAWVVGSGTDTEAEQQLRDALADEVPVVIDADALGHLDALDVRGAVLTPHAGELAELLSQERREIEARPLHFARHAAQAYDSVVLLKGRRTVIATPDGRARINTTGTPYLATAGAGDVLAGLIGALLAAGLDAFDAAAVGAWLHGSAAALASGGGPLVASDVARQVPSVIRALPRG